jgi:RHS repeat-associated protein
MERDEESGLSYHHKRMCCAWLGRWAAVDPTNHEVFYCRYGYCRGNPLNATDRSGEAQIPPGATPQSLLNDANRTLSGERLTHLDRGSSQALLAEAQGSGVVDSKHNTFIHHSDDVARDLASARKLISQIDTISGDKKVQMKSSLREQLIAAKTELAARVDTVQAAVDASNRLNADPRTSSRLTGVRLPGGRIIEDSLAVQAQQQETPPLLPDDPEFAGLLDDINKLPVRQGQKAAPPGALVHSTPAAEATKNVAPSNTAVPEPVSAVKEPISTTPPEPVSATPPQPTSFGKDLLLMGLKIPSQMIAGKVADSIALDSVNSMLKEVNLPPETEIGPSPPPQRDVALGLLGALPPGVDIGMAAFAGGISSFVTDVAFKPVLVEYYRQFPTLSDFWSKVYANP